MWINYEPWSADRRAAGAVAPTSRTVLKHIKANRPRTVGRRMYDSHALLITTDTIGRRRILVDPDRWDECLNSRWHEPGHIPREDR